MKYLLCLLFVVGSCSFKKDNQKQKGHEELYSEPSEPKLSSLSKDEKRIVIASTNDRHGNGDSPTLIEDDHNNKVLSIQIGGQQIAKQYFQILRDAYKNVVLVDSGDLFSEKMEMRDTNYYKALDYDAFTVGLTDFNLKVSSEYGNNVRAFEALAKTQSVPLVLSNLYSLKSARVVEWQGTKPYVLKDFGGVKVGIIGVIPDDIIAQTPVNNRVGHFVENMLQSTLRNSRLLKSLGADVIVVMTHQAIDCNTQLAEKARLPLDKVNFDPTKENVCDLNNSLGEYLQKLPPNLVDVVIGGRSHQKTANLVNGVVVMSGFPDGQSFNYAELVVNTKTNKIVPEKTVIHQPVMFCGEFFKETSDCYYTDPTVNHKPKIPASFLGKQIKNGEMARTDKKKNKITKDVSRGLIQYKADITFVPESTGTTQLAVVSLTGRELLKVLDEDFNQGRKDHWQPSPFLSSSDKLLISISGLDLEMDKTYKILSDLESLQSHRLLKRFISSYETESIMTASWHAMDVDTLSTTMSAQTR